jgi:shikimate dehydrogenase
MFDAVYAHYGLQWQFWKNDIASEHDLAKAIAALRPLGYQGMAITVPYKVAVIPMLDAVDDVVHAIGAANYITIEQGRLIGRNNDGKGVVMLVQLAMQIFERWTGITPEEAVFQSAVAEALGVR